MQWVFWLMEKVVWINIIVFIYGEIGMGKEVVVKSIYYNLICWDGSFVVVNMGVIF